MPPIEGEEKLRLLETEIERRLSERFAALREEFDRLRLESDRRWFGFLEKFNQDLKGVVPSELLSGEGAKLMERRWTSCIVFSTSVGATVRGRPCSWRAEDRSAPGRRSGSRSTGATTRPF